MKAVIWTLAILFSIAVIGTIWANIDNQNALNDFCKENGFEYSEAAVMRWDKSMCIKIKNNTRVEAETDMCGRKWCFVKQEGSE